MEDYIKNYALWASCRSVQRGWKGATFGNLVPSLQEALDIDTLFNDKIQWTRASYDIFLKVNGSRLLEEFQNAGLDEGSFGRATKLIAIYVKTSRIMVLNGQGTLCQHAHFPVDRILRKSVVRHYKPSSTCF